MSLQDDLANAIGAFKMQLDARDAMTPKRTRDAAHVIRTESGFGAQLPEYQYPQDLPPVLKQAMGCSIANVTMTPNGVMGTDFGPTTGRPIKMAYGAFMAAINQHATDPAFCPLSGHSSTLVVTPPCTPTDVVNGGVTSNSVQRVPGTCFRSESTWFASGGGGSVFDDPACPGSDPTCPATCTQRTAAWGASSVIDEVLDFGDISFSDASFAAVSGGSGIVWVSYAFTAAAEWNCSLSGCQNTAGGSGATPCVTDLGAACGPSGTSSSGGVCGNVTGIGDETSPPAGTTSTKDLVFSGSGWTTAAGVTGLFFQDPPALPGGCTGAFSVTY